ncbi:13308_t:CDS:1, partial [Racocetra fulgida]
AILELVATGSVSKLKKHFGQVLEYADKLCPREVWIVHFSREDSSTSDPYWPCENLQNGRFNIIHFWHDQNFSNVRMSSRFRDATGKFCEIKDEQILP